MSTENAAPTQSTALTPPGTSPAPAPRGLIMKLAEVMGAVSRIPKRGRNDFHGYSYATEADIVDAVRHELAARHVMVFPMKIGEEWAEVPRRNGGTEKLCTLRIQFDFVDGVSGEVLSVPMIGQGTDSGDKAAYKALTGAVKYLLTKTLLIPTGDDPEHEPAGAPQQPPNRAGSRPAKSQPKTSASSAPPSPSPSEELAQKPIRIARPWRDGAAATPSTVTPSPGATAPEATGSTPTPSGSQASSDWGPDGTPISEGAKMIVALNEAQTAREVTVLGEKIKGMDEATRDLLRKPWHDAMGRVSKAAGRKGR